MTEAQPMLEKLCLALQHADNQDKASDGLADRCGLSEDVSDWAAHCVLAILKRLREPNEEMMEAGIVARHNAYAYDDAVHGAWQAMIDTISGQQK
jgi:hypothetical protein